MSTDEPPSMPTDPRSEGRRSRRRSRPPGRPARRDASAAGCRAVAGAGVWAGALGGGGVAAAGGTVSPRGCGGFVGAGRGVGLGRRPRGPGGRRADIGHLELLRDGEQARLHVVHLRQHRLTPVLEPAEHPVRLLACRSSSSALFARASSAWACASTRILSASTRRLLEDASSPRPGRSSIERLRLVVGRLQHGREPLAQLLVGGLGARAPRRPAQRARACGGCATAASPARLEAPMRSSRRSVSRVSTWIATWLQVVVHLVGVVAAPHGGELAATDLLRARQERKIEVRHRGEPPGIDRRPIFERTTA